MIIQLLMLLLLGTVVHAEVPSRISATVPISGMILISLQNYIVEIDTFTGDFEIRLEQGERYIDNAVRHLSDGKIAYNDPFNTNILFSDNRITLIVDRVSTLSFFTPLSWSPKTNELLGVWYNTNTSTEELRILDTEKILYTTVRSDSFGESVSDKPELIFSTYRGADWNTVFSNWIVYELSTSPLGSFPESINEGTFVLDNLQTLQRIYLNDTTELFLQDLSSRAWSPNGQQIIFTSGQTTRLIHIATVLNNNGDWSYKLEKSGQDFQGDSTQWLGIEDILIFQSKPPDEDFIIFYLGQIKNGIVIQKEFLRIPYSPFNITSLANFSRGDFRLTADEAEKAAISCLFDDTLTSQLEVGLQGRVTLGGTTNHLRDNHYTDATIITQMEPGSAFTVVGGSYCADDYRWWQVQLGDGTTGWVAEATTTDYFLEPLS